MVGASCAPGWAVAAVKPRNLARSGDSPCHDSTSHRRAVAGRWPSDEEEPRQPQAERGARASLPAAPGIAPANAGRWRAWGEPLFADGPSHQRPAHRSAEWWGASPRAPSRRRGKPCCVERSKTEGEAEARDASSGEGQEGFPRVEGHAQRDPEGEGRPRFSGHGRRPGARAAGLSSRKRKGCGGP